MCRLYNVRDYIANYIIGDEAVIRNCGKIHTEGLTSFGNGTSVAVLNETGARVGEDLGQTYSTPGIYNCTLQAQDICNQQDRTDD